MQYSLSDLPRLLRAPLGKRRLMAGLRTAAYPILRRLAAAHRRLLIRRTRIVAVVGSFGKSTTARAVAASLGVRPNPSILFNSHSSLAWNLLLARPWDRHWVLEVGINGPGQMAGYAAVVRPDIVVVTSIGSEHHRSFGTLEVTRQEKSAMVAALPPDGIAVLNGDDPNVMWMAERTGARVVTYGFAEHNDVRGRNVVMDWPNGMVMDVAVAGEDHTLSSRLLGAHSLRSILAGLTVRWAEALPIASGAAALAELPPTPGRMEIVPAGGGITVIRDEFKSTLETIHSALDALAQVPARRRVAVLGDVSESPASPSVAYGGVGARLAEIADLAVCVGRHHRRYAAGAKRAGMPSERILNAGGDILSAIELVTSLLRPGDVVLVKGRDTQRLDRFSHAIAGRTVRCDLPTCKIKLTTCAMCPMLETGWAGHEVIV